MNPGFDSTETFGSYASCALPLEEADYRADALWSSSSQSNTLMHCEVTVQLDADDQFQ